jgi:hypothetical protein
MTPKQKERIQNKIKQIRKEIYEEKKLWGGYHDGRGLRYIPFELYLQIQDFKGGLTYLRWFTKTFPEDIGMPTITFMSSLIYFKNNKIKDAEKKALQTLFADSSVLDIFMSRPIQNKNESNFDQNSIKDFFLELEKQNDLTDFKKWLAEFEKSESYRKYKNKYQSLREKQKTETSQSLREKLLDEIIILQRLDNY